MYISLEKYFKVLFEYEVLEILKMLVIRLIICFIYVCTDEYHQTFVNGRTGQFSDALIDTLGGVIACLIYDFIAKLNKRRKKHV